MHSLYANMLNEAEKLLRQRKTKWILALTVLVPAAAAIFLGNMRSNTGVLLGGGTDFTLLMLGVFTSALLPLFLFMTAADIFAGEIDARTMKQLLTRPIARSKAFASKALAIGMYLAVLLAVIWIASTLSGLLMNGGFQADRLGNSIIAYAAAFVAMAAIAMFAIFIAQWFRSSSSALVLCIIIYIAAKLLPFFYPQIADWSIFSFTDWHRLWLGSGTPFGTLFHIFAFLLSASIITYMAGWYLFEKRQY